jgi:predicted ATP-grasp superfamily ATP-dependent carboligase
MSGNGAATTSRPLACVIGEIDLVRALGLAGISSVVVSPPGDFTRYSRFTRGSIDRVDARQHPTELVERLLAWSRGQTEKPVLYYNGDWDLLAVSRFREQLSTGFRFVVADETLVEDLVDKTRFQRLAEEHDLPVPRAVTLGAGPGAPEEELRFPVVVKPVTRHHGNWKPIARAKVIECETKEELAELRPRLEEAGVQAFVQELVPGPETLIESYHVYVDEDGAVVGDFTGKKIRTYPEHNGYSTALVLTDAPDLMELGRDIVSRIGLGGVAKFDFKRHPDDGRLYLLEVNPRFNLWHHPGAVAGVNIPELVYRDLVGLPRPPAATARVGVRWVSPWRDAQAVLAQHVPLRRWIPWMISCEAKCAVSWDDPLPFVRAGTYRAVQKLRDRLRPAG